MYVLNTYRYRRRCPDPNRIQKFIHYIAIATFAIADCHLGGAEKNLNMNAQLQTIIYIKPPKLFF